MTNAEQQAVLKLYGLESTEEATRETWPWWTKACCEACLLLADGGDGRGNLPFIPNFRTDDAAAVKLAEKMGSNLSRHHRALCLATGEDEGQVEWTIAGMGSGVETTLGGALLAALVSAT